MKAAARFVVILLVVGLAAVAFWQWKRAETAQEKLGLEAGQVLSAIFVQAQDLRVASLHGEVITKSENDGTIFHTEQQTRAPYHVNYYVDLGGLSGNDYRWNADRKLMVVHIPDISVERSAVDMSQAKTYQKGYWVSRQAGINLQQQAAKRLIGIADNKAKSQENLARARAAAVKAITQMIRAPMAAAGYGDVTVRVKFPWEGNDSTEQLDRSRSLEEVFYNT